VVAVVEEVEADALDAVLAAVLAGAETDTATADDADAE
jgi:hypothetical protein